MDVKEEILSVYPRVYGGTAKGSVDTSEGDGLGSIPACTGEPTASVLTRPGIGLAVYPRVYGGT